MHESPIKNKLNQVNLISEANLDDQDESEVLKHNLSTENRDFESGVQIKFKNIIITTVPKAKKCCKP
jgi:hypothetical protein